MLSIDLSGVVELISGICALAAISISLWVNSKVDARVSHALAKLKKEEIDPVAQTVATQREQISSLEARVDGGSTKEDVHKIAMMMEGMRGDLKAMSTRTEAIHEEQTRQGRSLQRVNDYLLNGKSE